ncbi:MAG: hypothetical protein WB967_28780 [Mycobacterium sp.]|uniref:hypothetical protein n=1 Tax=Mycobacterium sp. TaxID=1785 RepID=UPI003C529472
MSPETSAAFFRIIGDGIQNEKHTSAVSTRTFEQSTTQQVPPKSWGYVCITNPVLHYEGALTASAGNTTWTLPGVAADFPNPDSNAKGVIETWDTDAYYPGDPCPGFKNGSIKAHKSS